MKLVIFDLDRTLVDFILIPDEVTQRLFRKHFNVDARLTEVDFRRRNLIDNLRKLNKLKNISMRTFEGNSRFIVGKLRKHLCLP